MKTHPLSLFLFTILAVLGLAACNLPAAEPADTDELGFIHTAAAQTVMAQLTQVAQVSTLTPTSEVPPGGDTPTGPASPTGEQPEDPTQQPTITLSPTSTPEPTATQAPPTATARPTATPTPLPCNWAQFVKDVTVSDGTRFLPGQSFTKVWRLKNAGTCTWTTAYKLVFFSGDDMDGSSVDFPHSVKPGETIDIGVDLVAPNKNGTYTGYWKLRDPDGRFGIGGSADQPFWVEIKVSEVESGEVYNFATHYCEARWLTDEGVLRCPGRGTESSGFVVFDDTPDLEHRRENEPTIWTNPEMVEDGWITGTYPSLTIRDGDRFLADIGCMADNSKCDVIFQLNYRIGDGSEHTLGEWHEVYDGEVTRVDVDLSDLADEYVHLILRVETNGSYNQDAAFWLNPHILR